MAMSQTDCIEVLNHLLQLDIDAVEAYDQALKHIDERDIHSKILAFRQDHERHITNLTNAIHLLNGEPVRRTKDVKGFLIKGFTAIKSMLSTKQALDAMRTNEELTNRTYWEALNNNDLPPDIRRIVQSNYDDEQRHLAYIKLSLKAAEKGKVTS